jgi:hypothetical protein
MVTDGGFLYLSLRQVEASHTWTADAPYPADSPIPYTLAAKTETPLEGPASRRPPCGMRMLVVCELVLRKPDLTSPAYATRLRPQHETSVKVSGPSGSWDYRYPAHLTEPGASAYSPPPEPGVPALRGQVRTLNRRLDQAGLAGALDLAARSEELARSVRRPRRSTTKRPGRAVLAEPGPRGIRGATRRAEAMGRHGTTPQLRRIRAARLLAKPHSRDLGTIHPGCRMVPDLQRQGPHLPRALEFYDRWLPGSMRRVSEYTSACIGQCSVSRRLPYDWTGR